MDCKMDSETSSGLEVLFQQIITDMKGSFPVWEDFMIKATKLHNTLRATLLASSAFLESFQKVADMALGTRGSSSELGSALTRLCLRQRGIEEKFKSFANALIEALVGPLEARMDEWKKILVHLDKEHNKEAKRCQQELKKAQSETIRLKKKSKKGKGTEVLKQLEQSVLELNDRSSALEALQRAAVRNALVEQRSRFCFFITCLQPVINCEVAALSDATHVEETLIYLQRHTADSLSVTPSTDHVILDLARGGTTGGRRQSFADVTVLPASSLGGTQGGVGGGLVGGGDNGSVSGGSIGSRKSSLSSSSSGCPPPSFPVPTSTLSSLGGHVCGGAGGLSSPSHKLPSPNGSAPSTPQQRQQQLQPCYDQHYERVEFNPSLTTPTPTSPHPFSSCPSHIIPSPSASVFSSPSPSGGTVLVPEGGTVWSTQIRRDDDEGVQRTMLEGPYDIPPHTTYGPSIQAIPNPYAVPSLVSTDRPMTSPVVTVAAGYDDSLGAHHHVVMTTDTPGSSSSSVPLEGYVNMNQLACMAAVQQQQQQQKDIVRKKNVHIVEAAPNSAGGGCVGGVGEGWSEGKGGESRAGPRKSVPDIVAAGWNGPTRNNNSNNNMQMTVTTDPTTAEVSQRRGGGGGGARDRSLPPLSRHSTRNKTPLVHGVAGPPGVTVTPLKAGAHYCAVHGLQRGAMGGASNPPQTITTDPLPPPPLELQSTASPLVRAPSLNHDDVDDLPLPPPPEELGVASSSPPRGRMAYVEQRGRTMATNERGAGSSAGVIIRSKSVVSPLSAHSVAILPASAGGGKGGGGGEGDGGSFTDVIQRGVQLRRTVTCDRSAPRIPRT